MHKKTVGKTEKAKMILNYRQENAEHPFLPSESALCKVIGIGVSTLYRAKNASSKKLEDKYEPIRKRMHQIVEVHLRYGYRRMYRQLKKEGFEIGENKVLKLMKEEKLLCKKKKRYKIKTTQRDKSHPQQLDLRSSILLNNINKLWVGDITYIPYKNGIAYLCTVMDAYSRKVIGWHLSRDMDVSLTQKGIENAMKKRGFKNTENTQVVFHSDHGSQYTAKAFQDLLKSFGAKSSMGEVGNCYDNAMAESLNKTLKYEDVYCKEYNSFQDCKKSIDHYFEKYYNKIRMHSGIGYLSPDEFEDNLLVEQSVA